MSDIIISATKSFQNNIGTYLSIYEKEEVGGECGRENLFIDQCVLSSNLTAIIITSTTLWAG